MPPRILIVDDELIEAEGMRVVLDQLGYGVTDIAVSKETALASIGRTRPDLVLMDINLGRGEDGISAATDIVTLHGLPVVYVTAYADERTLNRAKISRPFGYVTKPFQQRDLQIAVEIALHNHETEQRRLESEARFRHLFEESPGAIWEEDLSAVKLEFDRLRAAGITDFRGYFLQHPDAVQRCAELVRIVDVNRASLASVGAVSIADCSRHLPNYFLPESWPVFVQELVALAEGATRFESEIAIRDSKGQRRILDLQLAVMAGRETRLDRVLVTFYDITERRRAEAAMVQEQTLLAQAEAIARIGSWRLVLATGEVTWSDEMFRIFGVERNAVSHRLMDVFAAAVHPEDRAEVDAVTAAVRRDGLPRKLHYRIVLPDGGVRWVFAEGQQERDDSGRVVAHLGVVQDITERRQAEEALRQSEIELKAAQRVAHVGSWVWHIQENRLRWSEEMFRIFGLDPAGFNGDLTDVIARAIHPEDRRAVEDANRSVMEAGKPVPLEYRVVGADGTVRTVWAEAGEMRRDAAGRPAILTGIVQDITERKEAERQLRQKMEILERFQAVAVNRELQMIALKKEINALLAASGRPEKYPVAQ